MIARRSRNNDGDYRKDWLEAVGAHSIFEPDPSDPQIGSKHP